MPQSDYLVRARSREGRLIEQRLKASSESEALQRVQQMGFAPLGVEPASQGWNREIRLGSGRVKLKDLAIMSRQMSTMLASGLPILRCLSVLAEQSESARLREVLAEVRASVERGSSLSEAMKDHREFPPLMVAMVQAGEVGGFLDTTMAQIAKSLEADLLLRGKIKAALTYPIAVFVIAILVVIGMLLFVVPVFEGLFESFGSELPAPTRFLVFLSGLLSNPLVLGPLLVIVIGGTLLYRRYKQTSEVRSVVDPIKFNLPVFGGLFRKVALARFARNFSALLRAGVPILTALDIVGDTSGNIVIARAVADVQVGVREGSGIAKPLESHSVFPEMVVDMIEVGEETGNLDEMLEKIADFYDQEVAATTEQLMALIEPIMVVILGGIVGGMIIALYLPIFSIFEVVQ
jgi:type IV pilus assembly protein PilC